MKPYIIFILSFIFIIAGNPDYSFAVSPSSPSSPKTVLLASASERIKTKTADKINPMEEEYKEDEFDKSATDNTKEEKIEIADPLEPFNRGMHQFNDKMYFWAIKPIAETYNKVVPEPARISVKNFFSNLGFPARFLSCLLQADFSGVATETGRFTINTIWGIGGFLDPSSGKELDLQKQDTDLGQTLGVWGVGQGFYIVWPVFGPSSPRDTVSIAGDYFLYPVSYIDPWYTRLGVNAYDKVNSASLRIGDYEALKDAAIDPYIAFRDAYVQYRFKKIKARKAKISSSTLEAEKSPTTDTTLLEKGN